MIPTYYILFDAIVNVIAFLISFSDYNTFFNVYLPTTEFPCLSFIFKFPMIYTVGHSTYHLLKNGVEEINE